MRQLNLVGKKFGKLLVIEKLLSNERGNVLFKSICDCGKERITNGTDLKRGRYSCCGCSNGDVKQRVRFVNPILYEVWKGLRARCRYKNHSAYKNYGGRGVTVCKEWDNDFKPFYNWCINNGWEKGMQIDKDIIPKKLGIPALIYSPEMCCIVSHKINCRNSRQAKLTQEKANKILLSNLEYKYLAEIYSVHISTIQLIKSKKAWVE